MKQYLNLRNDYELNYVIHELKKYDKLKHYIAPYKVNDEGRTIVRVDIYGTSDIVFNVEGRYDLVQLLLDKIHDKHI